MWETGKGGCGELMGSSPSCQPCGASSWPRQSQAGGGVATFLRGTSQITAGSWETTFFFCSCHAHPAAQELQSSAQPPGAFKQGSVLEGGSAFVRGQKIKRLLVTTSKQALRSCVCVRQDHSRRGSSSFLQQRRPAASTSVERGAGGAAPHAVSDALYGVT